MFSAVGVLSQRGQMGRFGGSSEKNCQRSLSLAPYIEDNFYPEIGLQG